MKYQKPELVMLSPATTAVRGEKNSPLAFDGIPQPAHYITMSAYDCDE
jgi:hypothetical protein